MLSYLYSNPIIFFLYIFALVLAVTIHEFSHAFAAYQLGDPTPKLQKRLNLNPLSHLDLLGALFLLFFGFGWGKPVEIDPYNLKNPRKDGMIISLAGPLSNFVLALGLSLILRLFIFFNLTFLSDISIFLFYPLIQLNLFLGLFNLLPIYPLDGFKIVEGLLPDEKVEEWYSLKKYGFLFLLLLIFPFKEKSMLSFFLLPIADFFLKIFIP